MLLCSRIKVLNNKKKRLLFGKKLRVNNARSILLNLKRTLAISSLCHISRVLFPYQLLRWIDSHFWRDYLSFLERDHVHLAEESVETSISFTSLSHESGESNGLFLSGDFTRWVNVGDLNLDGGVIIGCDETISGRALSWDVQIHDFSFIVLHFVFTSKTSPNLIMIYELHLMFKKNKF